MKITLFALLLLLHTSLQSSVVTTNELSRIFDELYRLDTNRFKQGKDFALQTQGRVGRNPKDDNANKPLFKYVDDKKLKSMPTYKSFIALLDNYETAVGVREEVSQAERRENNHFLDEVLKTDVMKAAHRFLVAKGLSPSKLNDFKKQLYDIWFKLYSRSRTTDSSAFEHVFVGERRGKKVLGLHNWIAFYLAEKNGKLDYNGIYQGDTQAGSNDAPLLTIAFDDNSGANKAKTGILVGSSPELDLAIYTIAWLTNLNKPIVRFGPYKVRLNCYELRNDDMGTCYMSAVKGY